MKKLISTAKPFVNKTVSLKVFKSRKEWETARMRSIGGSDAACITGNNPYKSNDTLYKEKMGIKAPDDLSGNAYVQYGTDAEKYLRELFALDFPQYKVMYIPNNMIVNMDYPFAHYSADGWLLDRATKQKGILEIKTTNINRGSDWDRWKDKIPDNYYIQCLHGLMVTGMDFVILKAQMKATRQNGDIYLETRHYRIDRKDVEEDIASIVEKETEFAEHLKNGTKPSRILPEL